jgi:PIN domain nuclease of toxin-antitoxin system
VTLLLDTHTLIWAITNPARLSRSATALLADPQNDFVVSAASAWEIATKVRLGKMSEAEPMEGRFMEAIGVAGYSLLSIDAETALRAGRLTGQHRDPFDRILAAHAIALDIPIISLDPKLDQFAVRRIW